MIYILSRIEKSIEIKAPPEKVWEMLALDKLPEWMVVLGWESSNIISEVRTPKDKYKVGAIAHIVEKRGEHDVEITESVENEKMTYRSKPPYYKYTATYILKAVQGGTELTWVSDTEMPWGMLGNFLLPFFQKVGEMELEKSLKNLKSILEK